MSCTAGLTTDNNWVRLFPVPYRYLDKERKFHKYQWIEVNGRRAKTDMRPESYRIDENSIQIISEVTTKNGWAERRAIVGRVMAKSLCELRAIRDKQGFPTLGVFRPRRIERVIIEATGPDWTPEQLQKLRNSNMFERAPTEELKKIPFAFKYRFFCEDCGLKNGHTLSCSDWELAQLYLRCKEYYGDKWEPKFRERAERDMIDKHDTHFFVGTVNNHPREWIIVGLFYPPKVSQPELPFFASA